MRAIGYRPALYAVFVLTIALSACGGGGSSPSSGGPTESPSSPTPPASTPTPPSSTPASAPASAKSVICATSPPASNYVPDGAVPLPPGGSVDCYDGWTYGGVPPTSGASAPTGTCLGPNSLCGSEPYAFKIGINVEAGLVEPLKAELVSCPEGIQTDNGAACVVSTNDNPGVPLAHSVQFELPNGNTGPITSILVQQIGPSVIGAPWCDPKTWAQGAFVKVSDSNGNAVYIPVGGTFSFSSVGCPIP